MFKWFLFGAIFVEIGLCIIHFINALNNSSIQQKTEWAFWLLVALYGLLCVALSKKIVKTVAAILGSKRIDLFIVTLSGACSMYLVGGIGIEFIKNWLNSAPWRYLILVSSLPIVFYVSRVIRLLQASKFSSKKQNYSLFLSDREGRSKSDDAFEVYGTAERFAERVYNQGSPESLVFGIDAPWGAGKSTFVNMCKEIWDNQFENKVIVYTFDPVKHENNDNVMEKFVNGLIKVIKENFYAPELESLMMKYVQLLNDSKVTFSMLGVSLGIPLGKASIDNILEKLEIVLSNIDKKIIIVIDDIDRLNFSSIKEVLFVVKKSFNLPNISYVMCYDTENITSLEQQKLDSEKIIEFLEKFVNIKISLYLDHKLLLQYFTENKDATLDRNLLSNPQLVSKAVEGLKDIFNSTDFHLYIPFIGDARKLKRLVNIIIMLEVEKLDFSNSDFDKHDLIHLLMIYMNYPNIFRKIYNTETQGKRGFFSLVIKSDVGFPSSRGKYKNSTMYTEYLKSLNENQQFILNQIFDVEKRLGSESNISEDKTRSYACFNGSNYGDGNRNLEQYLNLIIKLSRPVPTKQYRFYVNLKNEILNNISISEVFSREEFSFSNGEERHEQLWRVLLNTSHNYFSLEKSNEIIQYAVESLPNYSLLELQNHRVGLRNRSLPYIIIKLLDKLGWTDETGSHWNNSESNVMGIAEWIFGENQFENAGILDRLATDERGVLGLHDLLVFRLYCCTDQGGDIYNLTRSLYIHGGKNYPTSDLDRDIVIDEMREISQRIFQVFRSQYIDKGRNIFEEVLGLSLDTFCSRSTEYISSKMPEELLVKELAKLKSQLLSFMLYQLGGTMISSGVPCGYYDINGGKDQHEINKEMNNYLFDFCFNPQNSDKGHEYFLYYLYLNYETTYAITTKRNPSVEGFTRVLDKDRIIEYWKNFKDEIKSKKILWGSNEMAFTDSIEETYKMLDELLTNSEGKKDIESTD